MMNVYFSPFLLVKGINKLTCTAIKCLSHSCNHYIIHIGDELYVYHEDNNIFNVQ